MTFKLLQGDCLEMMKSISDASVDMILCDLPYGTTACKWDSVIPFEQLWEQYKRVCRKGGAIVLTASQPFTSMLVSSNLKMFKYSWVWEKNKGSNFATVKYQPMKEHEDVCVFAIGKTIYNETRIARSEAGRAMVRNPRKSNGHRAGDSSVTGNFDKGHSNEHLDVETRCARSILKFNTEVGLHPTQKPVALMEYLIRTYTNEGDMVLDNCMGSGTTGVACMQSGRKFIGMEMDAGYFEIAKGRIQAAGLVADNDNNPAQVVAV